MQRFWSHIFRVQMKITASVLSKKARAKLAAPIPNLSGYDIIFLGYPNWWGDVGRYADGSVHLFGKR